MEKLLGALHQAGVLRRSSLPARSQLDMHVPASEFLTLRDDACCASIRMRERVNQDEN
jgi:hypothetical protein